MSISIAHPEKYDKWWWTSVFEPPSLGLPAEEWELLGYASEDEDGAPCLWGHLKEAYR